VLELGLELAQIVACCLDFEPVSPPIAPISFEFHFYNVPAPISDYISL